MLLTSILQMSAANWANQTVKMSIDWMERDFSVYYYLQFADTSKYILHHIFICIIKEPCSEEGESTSRRYDGCQNTINDILGQIKWQHSVDMPMAKYVSTDVKHFWSWIIGNLSGDRLRPFINVELACFSGKRQSHMLSTAFWIWASMERQQFLVLHHWQSERPSVAAIHKCGIGWLFR